MREHSIEIVGRNHSYSQIRTMAVVEAQNLEVVWILFAPVAAYISKLGALVPACLDFFFLHSMST